MSVAEGGGPVRPRAEGQGASRFEGSIDRADSRTLQLWCRDVTAPDRAVLVDILINGRLFGRFLAGEYRPDLQAAGKGAGLHGLTIDVSGSPLVSDDGPLTIAACAADRPAEPFATIELRAAAADDRLPPVLAEHLRRFVPRLAEDLHGRSRMGWGWCDTPALRGRAAAPLMAPAGSARAGARRVAPSKFAEFTRQRMNVHTRFEVDQSSVETDNFYKWYLDTYVRTRAGAHAPLAASELGYLNELMIFGGQQYHLSRVTWMFLLDERAMLGRLDLCSPDSYVEMVYWWTVERSRTLWVDDCLVHPNYIQALGEVANRWRSVNYPLSRFMEIHHNRHAEWHFLDLEHEQDRAVFYALLLLDAARQPSLLQLLPRLWLQRMLARSDAEGSPLDRLVGQVLPPRSAAAAAVANYADTMRAIGFDLQRGKPTSITAEGHRFSNFGLRPEMDAAGPVDVQVIGPLHKASGLGQATRMSFDAIGRCVPNCSAFDFDMDNPAPAGFSAKRDSSPLRRAKINLIHLNAESVPLAYAYLPDVFTGAYNIGYFFWELDTPAACHSLALELLDEVWVSSGFGVEQYQPFTAIPVTRVGMSFEDVPVPPRAEARAFLQARLGHPEDCFVFFAAFDSFSYIQRKNPLAVIKAFLHAFPADPAVRLVLKTHNRDFVYDPAQRKIWQMLDEMVQADPRVSIINETLPYGQLLLLKTACDCYVSLHRSEGWGFGMIEAMHLGVSVLATGYSGNMEFCRPDNAWLVGFERRPVGPGDYIFVTPGQSWAEPDHADAVRQMRALVADGEERRQRSARAKAFVDATFSPAAVARRYGERLQRIAAAVPAG